MRTETKKCLFGNPAAHRVSLVKYTRIFGGSSDVYADDKCGCVI